MLFPGFSAEEGSGVVGGVLCLVNFKLTYVCVICVFVCPSMD